MGVKIEGGVAREDNDERLLEVHGRAIIASSCTLLLFHDTATSATYSLSLHDAHPLLSTALCLPSMDPVHHTNQPYQGLY